MSEDLSRFSDKHESSMTPTIDANMLKYVWSGGTSIGGQFYLLNVDVTDIASITGHLKTGSSYSDTTERFKIHLGITPTTFNPAVTFIASSDSTLNNNFIIKTVYAVRNSEDDFTIDCSNQTGLVNIVFSAAGWNVEITNVNFVPAGGYYTVKYNANGGNGTMANQRILIDIPTYLTANAFTREDYSFIGWATSPAGEVVYEDREIVVNIGVEFEIVDLYAKWQALPMSVILQRNQSENRMIDKDISPVQTLYGWLREESSIIDPVLILEADLSIISACNYCTIPKFGNRSYYIKDVRSIRTNLVEISCHVDVLYTYRSIIRQQTGIVQRQENNWNLYLNDGVFKVYQNPEITTHYFPSGFSGLEFVLAVAG